MSETPKPIKSFKDALDEFQRAWADARHTRFELPALPVNEVLREKYNATHPVQMSREKLWDMERKKAWNPAFYIPYVVSEGKSWGRHRLDDGSERFFRSSTQLGWIVSDRGTVLEEVIVDDASRRILFMGRASFNDDNGQMLEASAFQPLFHVEHAASGDADDPLNVWKIVLMTTVHDERYTEPFEEMARKGMLPGFVEIYIEQEYGCKLSPKKD
jgi:hypothetical protein